MAPENTLAALTESARLGLSYVEFDIRLTKDKVPVISHDNSLERCANDERLISETNWEDLKDVNVAATYALDESLDEKIPTLQSYLETAHKLGLLCQAELKPNDNDIDELASIAAQKIDAFYKNMPQENLPLVTSFSAPALRKFKDCTSLPIQTGILVKVEDIKKWQSLSETAQCDYVHMNVLYLTQKLATDIHNAGYKINGYHVNHPTKAKVAIDKGCVRFTCDIPDIFIPKNEKYP